MKLLFALPLAVAVALPAIAESRPATHVVVIETDKHTAYLGVGLHDVTEDNAEQLKLKEARGAVVVAVDHDGPAAKFIREHDVILELNHTQISSGDDVHRILHDMPAGRKVDVLLSRDGQQVSVQIVTGDRVALAHRTMPDMEKLQQQVQQLQPVIAMGDNFADFGDIGVSLHGALTGAVVESVGPQLAHYFGAKDGTGVLVREVRDQTAAAKAGMRAGDFILRVDGDAVNSRLDWDRKLHENTGKTIKVDVLRNHAAVKITLAVPAREQGALVGPDAPDAIQLSELVMPDVQIDRAEIDRAMQRAQDALKNMPQVHIDQAEIDRAMQQANAAMDSAEVKQAMADAQAQVRDLHVQVDDKAIAEAMREAQDTLQRVQPEINKAMREAADEMNKLDMQ